MTPDQIKQEAESFFEWPMDKRTDIVTLTSCLIFAKHCVAKATGWRPIAEAPKDGTYVIVRIPNYRGVRIAWNHTGAWIDDERGIGIKPTHFINIPPALEAA